MNCPKCGTPLRVSDTNPGIGLCDNCFKKFKLDTSHSRERIFEFKSGTTVVVSQSRIEIIRKDGKSATKTLFAGRTGGDMFIKLPSVTGVILYADFLLIFASGLPSPSGFKIANIPDIKQYPNCIVAKNSELQELYNYLISIIK